MKSYHSGGLLTVLLGLFAETPVVLWSLELEPPPPAVISALSAL